MGVGDTVFSKPYGRIWILFKQIEFVFCEQMKHNVLFALVRGYVGQHPSKMFDKPGTLEAIQNPRGSSGLVWAHKRHNVRVVQGPVDNLSDA